MCAFARRIEAGCFRWIVALTLIAGCAPFTRGALAAPLPATMQGIVSLTGASGTDAASASAPVNQAEMVRSLNSLISTLDNDASRSAFVAQLKALRDAAGKSPPAAPAPAKGDLLGAIASGIASVETNLNSGLSPMRLWEARLSAAFGELRAIATGANGVSPGRLLTGMGATLAGWLLCAFVLVHVNRRLFGDIPDIAASPNPASVQLLAFLLRRSGPWIVAFVVVVLFVRAMPDAPGRTLGLVIAYAILAGSVFSTLCVIVFTVFSTAHRRVAVRQLLARTLWLLFAIGACGALGDAAANADVARQFGPNLAGLVSTAANLVTALLCGYFSVAHRRQITHLIRNRPFASRRDHRFATEALDILASLWHIPILLIAAASVVAILDGRGTEGTVLRPSLLSAALLVLTLFASALLMHLARRRDTRAQRRAPHLMRLGRFVCTLLVLLLWLAYARFELEVWSGPLARLIRHSTLTPAFRQGLIAVTATVFGAWFIWIVIDTVILEALGPNSSRNKALSPGVRARTMLPLVRNGIFMTVASLAAIVAAASLGINLTPLLAGAGVIGLAVGFGAKSLVTDLITGLFIIVEETISVGDWIDIDGGHAGTVMDLTIRTVRLRDGQGAVHTIPFSQIRIVKNLSRDFAYALFEIRVPFDADLDAITRMIVDTGAQLAADFRFRHDILGPVEVLGLERFETNCIVVKGQIKTRPLKQWAIARALNARLKLSMEEAGLELRLPQMHVYSMPPRDAESGQQEQERVANAERT
ncbi:mechanosensitive ion channel family protein [Caballeronia concitans]|uniref:Mechanosensitive ion channel protein n=1 Tax=Caballeronia concitans TaxID=1777133 RepID=A0A658QXA3_9BURK|nr:mechanosensitive ion channel family protein [Caballeronia concitans]KIG02993.1 MscS Mechanosensitive ion channel [Burkholderia sp. MR1]SAL30343.1 mechanosensitive ion channel protein [Caballeronia concitans]